MHNSKGITKFQFYLDALEQLLILASNQKNPALWLYTNNARTTLFMLEGLSKLYAGIHNHNRFEKLKLRFKILEDTLGAIDYYDSFAKELTGKQSLPADTTDYLHAQAREKIQRLNDLLIEDKWMGDKGDRIKKIRKKLRGADWEEPKEELKAIFDFYKRSITDIKDFFQVANSSFTEIESQVHTIRRKLRWLSIYPQALQGVVQLKDNGAGNDTISKYLIPEIVNSKFNVMPPAGNNTHFLFFEKNYFLALSWIIAELGKIKDNGLKIFVVAEAFQQTEGMSQKAALDKSLEALGEDKDAIQKLLSRASTVCNEFFIEKNLEKLIVGISSAKKLTA